MHQKLYLLQKLLKIGRSKTMYNKKILSKALSDIAKKESASKYKICAIKGNIYILYAGVALYPTTNYIGLSIDNPDITINESTINYIFDNIKDEQPIHATGYICNDLTEFVDEKGNRIYCKTKLLKEIGIEKIKYSYFTYIEKKYICVYDDPAKNFLLAIICPVIRKEK